jgi:hypothetical protein
VHSTYAKTANQRLSYCRWCWLLPRTPQMLKRGVLAFAITPNTQHTNCNTLPAPHRPVLLLGVRWRRVGSRLQLGEIRMGPRHRQNGGQRWERHLGRSWWSLEWHVASSGRALLPAVRHPTKPAKLCHGWMPHNAGFGFLDPTPPILLLRQFWD